MHLRATGLILVSICCLEAGACSDAASTLQPKNDGGGGASRSRMTAYGVA
jgi:hypothetical protein